MSDAVRNPLIVPIESLDAHVFVEDYLSDLGGLLGRIHASVDGRRIEFGVGVEMLATWISSMKTTRTKVMLVGNGASASIAAHITTDLIRGVGVAACNFNDASLITCMGNDLGYAETFAQPVRTMARPGDLLVCLSSSGASPNIIRAAEVGHATGCRVVTLTGFAPDNSLRRRGNLSFYVPAASYGKVEIAHLALLHSICDKLSAR